MATTSQRDMSGAISLTLKARLVKETRDPGAIIAAAPQPASAPHRAISPLDLFLRQTAALIVG
jgi:hypothetical protein